MLYHIKSIDFKSDSMKRWDGKAETFCVISNNRQNIQQHISDTGAQPPFWKVIAARLTHLNLFWKLYPYDPLLNVP